MVSPSPFLFKSYGLFESTFHVREVGDLGNHLDILNHPLPVHDDDSPGKQLQVIHQKSGCSPKIPCLLVGKIANVRELCLLGKGKIICSTYPEATEAFPV